MTYGLLFGAVLLLGAVVLAVGLVVLVSYLQARRRREQFDAALEANQPEVARDILRMGWHTTALRGFALAGIGAGVLGVVCWQPVALSGLLIPAVVIFCGGVSGAVWAFACARSEGSPRAWAWLAAGGAALAAAALSYAVASRVHFAELPSPAETADFARRVEGFTGSPIGPSSPVIDGHQAHACLWGMPYGQQTCGSQYHGQVRFETVRPSFLNVYYVPDLESYLIIGTARVTPSGKVVTDGYITAREALGLPAGSKAP